MLITPEYRALNSDLHNSNPEFGAHGSKATAAVRKIVADNRFSSILDYGCGKGALKRSLPELDIREYDPAIPGKDGEPQPADLVVCTDVLEHIEPQLLDSVLAHIWSLTGHLFVCNISTIASSKTLADGRNAHLIVESPEWWREQLRYFFQIISCRDEAASVVIAAVPKLL